MAKVSVAEAARLFKVSRPTLTKALKKGTISGEKTVIDGSEFWQVDTAELSRSYVLREQPLQASDLPAPIQNEQSAAPPSDRILTGENTALAADLQAQLDEITTKLAAAEALAADGQKRAELAEAIAAERKERIEDLLRLLPKPENNAPREAGDLTALRAEVSQMRELVSKQKPRWSLARLWGG